MDPNLDLSDFEKVIGYSFDYKSLLKRALTTKSHSNEKHQKHEECEDQDGLRTLGDAVLKVIICDLLIRDGLKKKGEITIRKSEIENNDFLSRLGEKFEITNFMFLGKGEEQENQHTQPDVIANTLESVIGAMYIDKGFEPVQEVVIDWYEPFRN